MAVSDITIQNIEDTLTINLKSTNKESHYAILSVSLSLNTKHADYETLQPKIVENDNTIKEIVTEEFGKYTKEEVNDNKSKIKEQVLTRIQDLFQSDFIINVSFGNLILQ